MEMAAGGNYMKVIIFDAFGTLFKVTNGASARSIIKNINMNGVSVDEESFMKEWKDYYKKHTSDNCDFMTEREIFISRIQMFYDRYSVDRNAEKDADALLAESFEREAYPEVKVAINRLMEKYLVFIGSNTDNDVLESVMRKNDIKVNKVYTSQNLKCYKPSARFYKTILDENNLTPQEVLFVGDSIEDDIFAPKLLGIKTVWIDRNGVGDEKIQNDTILGLNELL